jgi:Spx/MgsR family transcriptional regulator
MIVYIHPKCTTCKNAVKFLQLHFKENQYTLVDITKTPPTHAELEQMLHWYKGDVKKLFNTSGIQYRELRLSEKLKNMSVKEALQLLSGNGMLVKRPFLLAKGIGLVGFNETAWEKLL